MVLNTDLATNISYCQLYIICTFSISLHTKNLTRTVRQGILVALGLVLGHLPDLDLNLVTRAFAESRHGDAAVECLAESVSPYADRVLSLVDLDIPQGSQFAPKDGASAGSHATDFALVDYIRVASD
jgi:hypothetical protein